MAERTRLDNARGDSPNKFPSGDGGPFGAILQLIVGLCLLPIALVAAFGPHEPVGGFSAAQSMSAAATPAASVSSHDVFDSQYKDTGNKFFVTRRLKTATALRSCASRSCSSSLQLERGWEIDMNVNDQRGGWVSVKTKDFLGQSKRGYVLRSALSPKVLSYSMDF